MRQPTLRSGRLQLKLIALLTFLGIAIAVTGGIAAEFIWPMHPLDVMPHFKALAFLGAFVGFVVGITLMLATKFRRL